MRSVLITLALATSLGVGGFIATIAAVKQSQNATATTLDRPITGDFLKDNAEYQLRSGVALDDLHKRQSYGIIGGGVGVAVGAMLGIAISMKLGRKNGVT